VEKVAVATVGEVNHFFVFEVSRGVVLDDNAVEKWVKKLENKSAILVVGVVLIGEDALVEKRSSREQVNEP
jgi:hypothetical protein